MTHVQKEELETLPDRTARQFGLLWCGEGVSLLGNSTSSVLLSLLAATHLHAGPGWMGALTAAGWLPWLVIGLVVGAWVDPLPPRSVMIVADLIAAVALASIPLAWWLGSLTLWQLLIVAFTGGVATVFFRPAYAKFIPLVVPDDQLEKANSRLNGTDAASQIVGPGLAGLLTRFGSIVTGILFDAISFCVSAWCLWRIRITPSRRPSRTTDRLSARIGEGIRLVAHDDFLRPFTIVGGLSNFGLTGFSALLVLYWTRELRLSPATVGVLFMIGSCGGVLGACLVSWLCRRFGTGRSSTLLLLISAPAAVLVGVPNSGRQVWLGVLGLAVMDAAVVAGNALRGAWRQRYVPADLMARVTTSSQVINFGTMPFAALVAGGLGSAIGVRSSILVLASVHALACLGILTARAGRVRDLPVRLALV